MLARLLDVDHVIRAWIVDHRIHAIDGVMVALSVVGRGGRVWIGIGLVLWAAGRMKWQRLAELLVALALATVTVDYVLKPLVDRHRPFTSIPSVSVLDARPNDGSFPSGHAGNAFAGATVLAQALPAWQPVWWTLAALIAFSRVYVGVHYPADVVGGAIAGAACAIVVLLASAALTRSGVKGT
ncbi:MAG TPA: phosphatase PAP2 family protein [Vicinamibacterales bacterium]|nr:phosphatase PAP2 family protein [Vicinamibacterales bacterium]